MSDNDVVKNRVPAFDATYMAFLLLEGLYASKEINLKTYTNMNFIPHEKEAWDDYKCVWNFEIGFEEAREYKLLNKGILRKAQWQNLMVHVYL